MSRISLQPNSFLHQLTDRLSRLSLSRGVAISLAVAAIISCAATFVALSQGSKNIDGVYWLLNLDLVLLLLFGTVVARQLVRLWGERQRGVAGAKLHIRLVFLFSVLTAVPAIMMAVFSALFLYFGMQVWFNVKVSTAVHESLEVAKAYLNEHQQVMRADALAMATDLNREAAELIEKPQLFNQVIQTQSMLRNLPEAVVIKSNGQIIAGSNLSFSLSLDKIPEELFDQADVEDIVLMTGTTRDSIKALVKLKNYFDSYLYVGRMVDGNVIQHMDTAETAVKEYTSLDGRRSQMQISTTLMFVALALLLLLAAIWFGFSFSEQLAAPIRDLINASEKVSSGDLSARVPPVNQDDEIGLLGSAFNRMTTQLQSQQGELLAANRMLDQRRRFTEAVLAGASSGIIGLDKNGVITLGNLHALELLTGEGDDPASLTGKKLSEFIPEMESLHEKLLSGSEKSPSLQMEYAVKGGPRKTLLIRLIAEQGMKSAVVTIDDISTLVSAQRSAAWADVARRIAHEIKNPLTPIQLSAERLNRKYLPQIQDDPDTFSKCTETIIRQVQDIGHLVNEFSAYARMPVAVKKIEDMAKICQDALILQKQGHEDVSFDFRSEVNELSALCDRSQITQVITNLLQNAIDSIDEKKMISPIKGQISFTLAERGGNVAVTVADNGLGLPEKVRDQLLEPYVTTKKKGSGLGLAIVKKIMEDHGGSVVLEDNIINDAKNGAKVTMIFPRGI